MINKPKSRAEAQAAFLKRWPAPKRSMFKKAKDFHELTALRSAAWYNFFDGWIGCLENAQEVARERTRMVFIGKKPGPGGI